MLKNAPLFAKILVHFSANFGSNQFLMISQYIYSLVTFKKQQNELSYNPELGLGNEIFVEA